MSTRTLNGRPLPWPLRLLGWLFRGVLVLLITLATAAVVIMIGATAYYELTRTKAGDLDEMIEAKLPPGASADRIITVLDSEGIEHGAVEPFPGDDNRLLYAGVTKGTPVISAIVRNQGHSLEFVDVQITFILDDNGALKDHEVYEVHRRSGWLKFDIDALKE